MAVSVRSGIAPDVEATDAAVPYPAMTRLQSFRHKNRHKPFKQALYLLGFLFLLMGYVYVFFCLQPSRSYENVSMWNAEMDFRIRQIQSQKEELKRFRKIERESERGSEAGSDLVAPDPLLRVLSFVLIYLTCTNKLRQCLINRRSSRWMQMDGPVRPTLGSIAAADDRLHQTLPTIAPSEYSQHTGISSHELGRLMALRMPVESQQQQVDPGEGTRGANASRIAVYPTRTVASADDPLLALRGDGAAPPQCDICLAPYRAGDRVRTIPCFHAFHTDCIDAWLARRAACPVCLHPL